MTERIPHYPANSAAYPPPVDVPQDEFVFDEEEMLEMCKIEEECGCEISAGIDHGANLANYIAHMMGMDEQ